MTIMNVMKRPTLLQYDSFVFLFVNDVWQAPTVSCDISLLILTIVFNFSGKYMNVPFLRPIKSERISTDYLLGASR